MTHLARSEDFDDVAECDCRIGEDHDGLPITAEFRVPRNKIMERVEELKAKLAEAERVAERNAFTSNLHWEGLREHKYAREAVEEKLASTRAELEALRKVHTTPYLDEEHQGGFCGDAIMNHVVALARAERELATTREELADANRAVEYYDDQAKRAKTAARDAKIRIDAALELCEPHPLRHLDSTQPIAELLSTPAILSPDVIGGWGTATQPTPEESARPRQLVEVVPEETPGMCTCEVPYEGPEYDGTDKDCPTHGANSQLLQASPTLGEPDPGPNSVCACCDAGSAETGFKRGSCVGSPTAAWGCGHSYRSHFGESGSLRFPAAPSPEEKQATDVPAALDVLDEIQDAPKKEFLGEIRRVGHEQSARSLRENVQAPHTYAQFADSNGNKGDFCGICGHDAHPRRPAGGTGDPT